MSGFQFKAKNKTVENKKVENKKVKKNLENSIKKCLPEESFHHVVLMGGSGHCEILQSINLSFQLGLATARIS